MALKHLFDAELEDRPGMAPLAEDGEGQLIGSGDGTVDGQRVRGALRWTLFEGPGSWSAQAPRQGLLRDRHDRLGSRRRDGGFPASGGMTVANTAQGSACAARGGLTGCCPFGG